MNEKEFDVIVVGGGVIGCTSAYFLARAGLKVALVEQARLAGGTTGSSFAWINATSKTGDEAYHRLNALGLAGYGELAAEFGDGALGINRGGALKVVRRGDADAYAGTRAQADLLAQWGYPAAWLDGAALRALEPNLALPDDAEALYSLADLNLDAPRFARFMAARVRALGGLVLERCAAHTLDAGEDGQVRGLVTAAGTLRASKLLIAAGPGTPEVLSELTGYDGFSARFPLRRVPGLLVTTPDLGPRQLLRRVVYFADGPQFHLLPDFNGGLKLGADDTDGMIAEDPSPEGQRRAARLLLGRAAEAVPGFAGAELLDQCRLAIGVRPYPADGVSLAGPLPGAQGLYVAATHSGITLAPALGRLLAQSITTGQTPEALVPFGLERIEGLSA